MSPINDEDEREALVQQGWIITDRSGPGFTVLRKGFLEETRPIGMAEVTIMAVNDGSFQMPGRVTLSARDIDSIEVIAMVGGWRGHAEDVTLLRAQAAVLSLAADLVENWLKQGDRAVRVTRGEQW